jgi:Xaa-Pro dipeptidase
MRTLMDRIKKVFAGTDVDAIVLANTMSRNSNFLYLTGFTSGIFESTFLVVTRDGAELITSPLEYETAMLQRTKEMAVAKPPSKGYERYVMAELQKKLRNKRIGIDGNYLPTNMYTLLKKKVSAKSITDVSIALTKARETKDDGEISTIRRANRVVLRVLDDVKAGMSRGMTELQLAAKVDYLMMEYGATGPSFRTIVCFDKNAALPHHAPDSTRLKENGVVLIDCGAIVDNYCSDVTRTFFYKADRSTTKYKRVDEMIGVVKEAQEIALEHMVPGAPWAETQDAVTRHIDRAHGGRYRGTFIHGFGHPLGIDVHDPWSAGKNDLKFRSGMVFSDEPGIYITGFGGVRIEDDVVIKGSAAKRI